MEKIEKLKKILKREGLDGYIIPKNDEFEFNQDNSIEFDEEYRSPGWDRYKKNKMLKWKK